MNRLLALPLLLAVLALSACANRSIDEAYGVPDALDWSYFRADPADVARVAAPVLRHRVLVNFHAEAEGVDADRVVAELLDAVRPT